MPTDSTVHESEPVERRLEAARARIAELTPPGRAAPRLMGVTKRVQPAVVRDACAAGLDVIGESYVDEWVRKYPELGPLRLSGVEVHFIGQLQTNKVRRLVDDDGAPLVDVVESVDRLSLVDRLARVCPTVRVLIQVDLAGAVGRRVDGRGGCALGDVGTLVEHARSSGLVVDGLMGVAPQTVPDERRRAFDLLVECADVHRLEVRSIGMSDDVAEAIAAGSTLVRLGTALFGRRS